MIKKVVFICNEFPPMPHGGIGVFVKNLTNGLIKNGFECTVVGLYPLNKKLVENIDGITIIRLKEFKCRILDKYLLFKLFFNFLNRFKLSLFILNYERLNKPEIIESYEWNGPLLFKPQTKLIIRLHGSNTAYTEFEKKPFSKVLKFYESLNIKMGDVFVSVSKHMLEITENSLGIIDKPKQVIYNSYNDVLFKEDITIIRNPERILFVGKFHERKGVFELFKILNEIFFLDSSFSFHFVGPHTEDNRVSLLSLLNVDFHDNVIFSTSIPQYNLPKVYCESRLLIMPSRAEAFGITTIEAMACGCVVAMSSLPVSKEIIEDNYDGLIINTFDYKVSANRIIGLMKNHDLISLMSNRAIEKVKGRFSSEKTLTQNLNFYNGCIDEN
jgi:glycosyltransferase involved in cell wall biosynthesis